MARPIWKGSITYSLRRDALKRTERAGVGTIVLRQREHLGALDAVDDALVLSLLRYAHEIRGADTLDLPKEGEGYQKREMDLDVLREVIEKKVEGQDVTVAPQTKKPARVVDLVKALEESLRAPVRRAA